MNNSSNNVNSTSLIAFKQTSNPSSIKKQQLKSTKKKKKKTQAVTGPSSSNQTGPTTETDSIANKSLVNIKNQPASFESITMLDITSSSLPRIETYGKLMGSLGSQNGSRCISLDGYSSGNDSMRRWEETSEDLLNNPSLRWHNQSENDTDERIRIELYKVNRRKRYMDQRKRVFLPSIFNSSSSNIRSGSSYNDRS